MDLSRLGVFADGRCDFADIRHAMSRAKALRDDRHKSLAVEPVNMSVESKTGMEASDATAALSRNSRHNAQNTNELYEERLCPPARLSNKRQFLAQVTEPPVFVNAS